MGRLNLSVKLERARTDRPDEWSMDEYSRQARELEDALKDAVSGLRYIRASYPDIYGVGFDRVEEKSKKALGE